MRGNIDFSPTGDFFVAVGDSGAIALTSIEPNDTLIIRSIYSYELFSDFSSILFLDNYKFLVCGYSDARLFLF